MKIYLQSLLPQLKRFSDSLDKKSLFTDKPWALIDDESEIQRLIFKRNNELILSKNGQVQIGRWEYLPEARSILIDRVVDKILCNEAFIDKGVMILKLDGTENKFFMLANENIVSDLDVQRYLKELRYKKLNIAIRPLKDGRILEIERKDPEFYPAIGDMVTIEGQVVKDGKYPLVEDSLYFRINSGRIASILTEVKYKNPDGIEIVIHQKNYWEFFLGDDVLVYGQPASDGVLNFSKSMNLVIHEGKIVKTQYKNKILRAIMNGIHALAQ